MDWVEERAAQVLDRVPPWLWDGETLPVPVEDIADSVFGLLIRDVTEMDTAPGAPQLAFGQELSGLLLATRGEIWVNARDRSSSVRRGSAARRTGPRGGGKPFRRCAAHAPVAGPVRG